MKLATAITLTLICLLPFASKAQTSQFMVGYDAQDNLIKINDNYYKNDTFIKIEFNNSGLKISSQTITIKAIEYTHPHTTNQQNNQVTIISEHLEEDYLEDDMIYFNLTSSPFQLPPPNN